MEHDRKRDKNKEIVDITMNRLGVATMIDRSENRDVTFARKGHLPRHVILNTENHHNS